MTKRFPRRVLDPIAKFVTELRTTMDAYIAERADALKTPKQSRLAEALLILLGVPILGVLMGGVYSLPAMKLTKERDPGLTLLLGISLGITVIGLGGFSHTPLAYLAGTWGFALVLLIGARRLYGNLGHSLERSGIVHAVTLLITAMVCMAARIGTRRL